MKVFFIILGLGIVAILFTLAFCKMSWKNDKPYKDPYEDKK